MWLASAGLFTSIGAPRHERAQSGGEHGLTGGEHSVRVAGCRGAELLERGWVEGRQSTDSVQVGDGECKGLFDRSHALLVGRVHARDVTRQQGEGGREVVHGQVETADLQPYRLHKARIV